MYSRYPGVDGLLVARAMLLAALASTTLVGCDREKREYGGEPKIVQPDVQPMSPLRPGTTVPGDHTVQGAHYENVAYHVSQGAIWFQRYNCVGCHGNGGGGMGPALMDDKWRYGGSIDAIRATVLEGRPNGMPSFKDRLTDTQAWQVAAYVRALSGNVRKDAVPSRREGLAATPPLTQMPRQEPAGTDTAVVKAPQP